MPAPAFYAFAIAFGALTIGATATDAKKWMGTDHNSSAALQSFYNSRFTSSADCLNGAISAGAPLKACAREEPAMNAAVQSMEEEHRPAALQAFGSNRYESATDCLNAAAKAGLPLSSCRSNE